MRIWLDLANSPQVLFFRPIVAELTRLGHQIDITTRAYAQTIALADQLHLPHTPVGSHGGRKMRGLLWSNLSRSLALRTWALQRGRFDLAVSHNSYSQAVAAATRRIPFVTLMDYEHQLLNHLCFRLARRVIVPEAFPAQQIARFGAAQKTVRYAGIKEQVYLADFEPDPDYRRREALPDTALAVVRPPAPWTAYHRFENDLFDGLLAHLASLPGLHVLFLPRIASQAETVRGLGNVHVASKVYDGPNLLYHADVVISGGGTMNRESAVLGTPTYTVFKGKLGAVDRYLIDKGRMVQIETADDYRGMAPAKKTVRGDSMAAGRSLLQQVTAEILGGGEAVAV